MVAGGSTDVGLPLGIPYDFRRLDGWWYYLTDTRRFEAAFFRVGA